MNFLKTKNYQLSTKRKAFTLMEILIAASIFAIVMVIATGILGQSSSFRGKIKATREVSEDTKKISDMITRDVREAGYPARITLDSGTYDFKTGIVMINKNATGDQNWPACFSAPCIATYPTINSGIGGGGGAVLILASKDSYKIYHFNFGNSSYETKAIFYKTIPRLSGTGTLVTLDKSYFTNPDNTFTKINSNNTEISFSGHGFAPDDTTATKQQPFLRFSITAQTKNYGSLTVNQKALMTIQSEVTARNFAN